MGFWGLGAGCGLSLGCALPKIYVLLSKGFVVNDGRPFWPPTDYFFTHRCICCVGWEVFHVDTVSGTYCGAGLLRMWAINLSCNQI